MINISCNISQFYSSLNNFFLDKFIINAGFSGQITPKNYSNYQASPNNYVVINWA